MVGKVSEKETELKCGCGEKVGLKLEDEAFGTEANEEKVVKVVEVVVVKVVVAEVVVVEVGSVLTQKDGHLSAADDAFVLGTKVAAVSK